MDDTSPIDQYASAVVLRTDKDNIKIKVVFNCTCSMELVESRLTAYGMMQFKSYCNTHFYN